MKNKRGSSARGEDPSQARLESFSPRVFGILLMQTSGLLHFRFVGVQLNFRVLSFGGMLIF